MDIDGYVSPLTEDQRTSILAVRALVLQHNPDLVEVVDEGKWFGGMLTYTTPEGLFCFA